MGKQTGFIKIVGTFDDLTFYKLYGKYLIKKKSTIDGKRILNAPEFARTRENLTEFKMNTQMVSLLRNSVGPVLRRAKDPRLSSRLFKIMNEIKKMDSVSLRGKRSASQGILTPGGKLLLKGLDFNIQSPLQGIFHGTYIIDHTTGSITFEDLNLAEQLAAPETATHVNLRTGIVNLNFDTGIFTSNYSENNQIPINNVSTPLTLTPDSVPTGDGIQIHLLLIEFYQSVNGMLYPLNDNSYNCLNIIEVV